MFNFYKRKNTKTDSTPEKDLKGVIGQFTENDNRVGVFLKAC
jgi:hypothetical protein